MRIISEDKILKITNSPKCEVNEYPFGDKDINGSLIKINGRYPEYGYAVNEVCKELVYVTKGSGSIKIKEATAVSFMIGDSIIIDPKELFYWEGDFESFMVCTPAFDPSQHRLVN